MLDMKNLDVAVDFVQSNPYGLSAVHTFEDARHIIYVLDKRGMSPGELVDRMHHSPFLELLLQSVFESTDCWLHPDKKILFGVRVWELRLDETFNAGFVRFSISKIFEDQQIYEHLLATVPLAELSVFVSKAPDGYWGHRIRGFIVKGDLDRAWDEILKAYCPVSFDMYPSGTLLHTLLKELVEAVGERKLKKSSPRSVRNSHKVDFIFRSIATDGYSRGMLQILHNHFGGRKAERRRTRNKRKLAQYEARYK